MFNVSLAKQFLDDALPPTVDPLTVYELVPDSVWIDASLLAANAPAGLFIGLKIKGGTVTLSAPPHLVNGKLTLAAKTRASVTLNLDAGAAVDADPGSPYGGDARNAKLQLPELLEFHFSGGAGVGAIDAIGTQISWNVYGQAGDFQWNPQRAPEYEPLLNRVLIPMDCSVKRFDITDCTSPFTTLASLRCAPPRGSRPAC